MLLVNARCRDAEDLPPQRHEERRQQQARIRGAAAAVDEQHHADDAVSVQCIMSHGAVTRLEDVEGQDQVGKENHVRQGEDGSFSRKIIRIEFNRNAWIRNYIFKECICEGVPQFHEIVSFLVQINPPVSRAVRVAG